MDAYQQIVKHVIFPLNAWRQGSRTLRHLRDLEESQYLPADRIAELQMERLRALLTHAARYCPFYAERIAACGLDPSRVRSPEDLRRMPLLSKSDIQHHAERMKATCYPADSLVPNKTGGSTGAPLHYYHDRARLDIQEAAAYRHNRWAGWDIGTRTALIWGHREDVRLTRRLERRLRNRFIERRVILDTSSITREKLAEYSSQLARSKPEIYIGYANSVYLLARFLRETRSTDHHRPRAIITSAEVLEPTRRKLIEEVFECPVFDRYGARETSVIASECGEHSGLHINAEGLLLEFIRDGRPVGPGEVGQIVVTDLLNFGMPFIRYKIEDAGIPLAARCACGRGLPLMKLAGGRVTDFLLAADGRIVSGAALTIYLVANAPGVAQAQIVQEREKEITLRIVKGEGFGPETLSFLAKQIPAFFGDGMRYSLEYCDLIPVEPSGKYRFSISKLDPGLLFG
jgi:phenylacetate-CoA ligase